MNTINIKERIQGKEGKVRGLTMRTPLNSLPPWRLYKYIHIDMIKQPQV